MFKSSAMNILDIFDWCQGHIRQRSPVSPSRLRKVLKQASLIPMNNMDMLSAFKFSKRNSKGVHISADGHVGHLSF